MWAKAPPVKAGESVQWHLFPSLRQRCVVLGLQSLRSPSAALTVPANVSRSEHWSRRMRRSWSGRLKCKKTSLEKRWCSRSGYILWSSGRYYFL